MDLTNLDNRKEYLPALAKHFLKKKALLENRLQPRLSMEAEKFLANQ